MKKEEIIEIGKKAELKAGIKKFLVKGAIIALGAGITTAILIGANALNEENEESVDVTNLEDSDEKIVEFKKDEE